MQVQNGDRVVVSSGGSAKGQFGISARSQAHIMTILRDTLYTDKILAVLREYSSNAWDAHRMIGKGDVPIKITLPVLDNPTLCIRDYGPGMSPDEVFTIYTQYGESTKRDTNEAVGMMGIGSKSAFAYSDSFTVTAWNGGKKRVYVAVLDASNIGEIQCLDESDCDPEETGVEIQVPIRADDVHEFKLKAVNLFRYFDVQPEINIPLPKINRDNRTNGFVSSDMHEWVAVMGCIPYRLNLDQIKVDLEVAGLWNPLQKIKGGLYFKIGEVNVSASREELKYTEFTRKAIVEKFTAMVDEHIEKALKDIKDANLTDWEKRVKANFMTHVIGFKLPKGFTEWSKQNVDLWGYLATDSVPVPNGTTATRLGAPKTFVLFKSRQMDQSVHTIAITQGGATRFVIKDDPRPLKGFQFNTYDYVIVPVGDAKTDAIKVELTDYITSAKLTGVPIVTITEAAITWYKPYEEVSYNSNKNRTKNPKHWTKAFNLKDHVQCLSSEHSRNWEPATWVCEDTDVYVALDFFAPKSFNGASDFIETVKKDRELAKWLGLPFPTIHGYKDTITSPLKIAKIKGTEYKAWRVPFFKAAILANPEVLALIETMSWSIIKNGTYLSDYYTDRLTQIGAKMATQLPAGHVFTTTVTKMAAASAASLLNRNKIEMIERVISMVNPGSESKRVMAKLEESYPLIFRLSNIFQMGEMLDDWVSYIKTCDLATEHLQMVEDAAMMELVDAIEAMSVQTPSHKVIDKSDDLGGLPMRVFA